MHDTVTIGCSCQKKVSFQWPAVTFSERAPITNPFLTKSKKSDDRHVQRTQHKHGGRSYHSVGGGYDSQSLLEREPTRILYPWGEQEEYDCANLISFTILIFPVFFVSLDFGIT